MPKIIEKVTAFITRQNQNSVEPLLLEHPYAGNQLPAGTVNPGENAEDAVLREVREETGLTQVKIVKLIGVNEEKLPENSRVIIPPTKVYARPDRSSFDWSNIPSAVQVRVDRQVEGFSQITYIENDREPDPTCIILQITGWVPDDVLADTRRRYFYHLDFTGQSEDRWTVFSDNHTFSPFWTSLNDLPKIISPQDEWLVYIKNILE